MGSNRLTDTVPPPSARHASLPMSRRVSWLVSSLIVGWLIVYNVLRFGGRSPSEAAGISVPIGVGVGLAIWGVALLVWRRFGTGARFQADHMNEIPPASRLDGRQRGALEFLWPAVGLLSLASLVVGVVMAIDWFGTDVNASATVIVIAAWNILVGLWLAFETTEIRRGHGEAVESIGTASILTAVLSGVALSRNVFEWGQGTLIVLAGITGFLAYSAGWRLLGSRGIPFSAVGSVIVAGLAIAIPVFWS